MQNTQNFFSINDFSDQSVLKIIKTYSRTSRQVRSYEYKSYHYHHKFYIPYPNSERAKLYTQEEIKAILESPTRFLFKVNEELSRGPSIFRNSLRTAHFDFKDYKKRIAIIISEGCPDLSSERDYVREELGNLREKYKNLDTPTENYKSCNIWTAYENKESFRPKEDKTFKGFETELFSLGRWLTQVINHFRRDGQDVVDAERELTKQFSEYLFLRFQIVFLTDRMRYLNEFEASNQNSYPKMESFKTMAIAQVENETGLREKHGHHAALKKIKLEEKSIQQDQAIKFRENPKVKNPEPKPFISFFRKEYKGLPALLKSEFTSEKGLKIKMLITSLKDRGIILFGDREFMALYTSMRHYFDRNIGTYPSINDFNKEKADAYKETYKMINDRIDMLISKCK